MPRNRLLAKAALVAGLVVPALALSTEMPLFSVDPHGVMDAAIGTVRDRFPGVSPNELKLEGPVTITCPSTRPEEQIPLHEEEIIWCMAGINFNTTSSNIEFTFVDRDGNCVIAAPPSDVSVNIRSDGGGTLGISAGSEVEERVVECTDNVISSLATVQKEFPSGRKPFSVDPKKILARAFEAVAEAYPDVPPNDFAFEGLLQLWCDTVPPWSQGISLPDVEFRPCTARLKFLDRSVTVGYKYIDDEKCYIGDALTSIKVRLGADGSTEVGSRSVDYARGDEVECGEDFYKLPLPTAEWSQ